MSADIRCKKWDPSGCTNLWDGGKDGLQKVRRKLKEVIKL